MLLDIRGGDGWAELFLGAGITPPTTQVHTSMTCLYTLELARAGVSIALAHKYLVADDVRRGDLAAVAVGEVPAREQYYLVTPSPDRATTAALGFTRWLQAELRRVH